MTVPPSPSKSNDPNSRNEFLKYFKDHFEEIVQYIEKNKETKGQEAKQQERVSSMHFGGTSKNKQKYRKFQKEVKLLLVLT